MTRIDFYTYIINAFKRTDKDTEIYTAYNNTIVHLSNLKPLIGRKFTSWIPSKVDRPDYPIPCNLCHVFHPVRIIESLSSSNGYPMNKLARDVFMEKYPNQKSTDPTRISRGMPVDYTIYSDQIWTGPLSDKDSYIFELDWAKKGTPQNYASDIHELGDEWDEVIKYGTLARLYEDIGLTSEADRYWILYRHEDLGYPALMDKEEDQSGKMEAVKNRDL